MMESFYGGKVGTPFIIRKTYPSKEIMDSNFEKGNDYKEIAYGEYVMISNEDPKDIINGDVYRRGFKGAEFIGNFRGPQGTPFKFQGIYDNTKIYKKDLAQIDIVYYNGNAYIRNGNQEQISGISPEDSEEDWFLFAKQGNRGSVWYSGTEISGVELHPTIYENSGIDYAIVNDFYLNVIEGNIYKCEKSGTPSEALWSYQTCLDAGIFIDQTLTKEQYCADAKATGDAIKEVKDNYLPLTGGKLSGDLEIANEKGILLSSKGLQMNHNDDILGDILNYNSIDKRYGFLGTNKISDYDIWIGNSATTNNIVLNVKNSVLINGSPIKAAAFVDIDSSPSQNSPNAITSGSMYAKINTIDLAISSVRSDLANEVRALNTTITANKTNIESSLSSDVKALTTKINTNANNIATKYPTSGGTLNGGIEIVTASPFIDFHYNNSSADYDVRLINNESGKLHCKGHYAPTADDTYQLGYAGKRWKQLYANTSTISTSDRNLKYDFKEFDEKYDMLYDLLKPYLFKLINGDSGRSHSGFISQDVEEALQMAGLTALDFAGFCKDVKQKSVVVAPARYDENGNIISEAMYESVDDLDENGKLQYEYSLRYEEFIALNTDQIQKLKKENKELKETINNLLDRIVALENR